MRKTLLAAAVVAVLLGGCATGVEKGFAAAQKQDYETALKLWLPLAKSGNALAQNNVGYLWEHGLTAATPKSDDEAADWYIMAARQGVVLAMINLANLQLRAGNDEAARSWLELAARWNDQSAIATLQGRGWAVPPPDLAAARQQEQLLAGAIVACAVGGCGRTRPDAIYDEPSIRGARPRTKPVFSVREGGKCVYLTKAGRREVFPANGVCPAIYE